MGVADASGLPVALCTGSASPHEIKYVEPTLERMFVDQKPEKLIGDKAYDSDKLDSGQTKNAGRQKTPALQKALESRTVVCMVAKLP